MSDTEKARIVRDYARGCNGAEAFHQHSLARRLFYTDGVRFIAETCGAYWLVDAIASYVSTSKAVQAEDFQVWTLKVHTVCGRTMLVCTNGNDDVAIVSQKIEYTDFPSELLPFKLFCENNGDGFTLMFPEER